MHPSIEHLRTERKILKSKQTQLEHKIKEMIRSNLKNFNTGISEYARLKSDVNYKNSVFAVAEERINALFGINNDYYEEMVVKMVNGSCEVDDGLLVCLFVLDLMRKKIDERNKHRERNERNNKIGKKCEKAVKEDTRNINVITVKENKSFEENEVKNFTGCIDSLKSEIKSNEKPTNSNLINKKDFINGENINQEQNFFDYEMHENYNNKEKIRLESINELVSTENKYEMNINHNRIDRSETCKNQEYEGDNGNYIKNPSAYLSKEKYNNVTDENYKDFLENINKIELNNKQDYFQQFYVKENNKYKDQIMNQNQSTLHESLTISNVKDTNVFMGDDSVINVDNQNEYSLESQLNQNDSKDNSISEYYTFMASVNIIEMYIKINDSSTTHSSYVLRGYEWFLDDNIKALYKKDFIFKIDIYDMKFYIFKRKLLSLVNILKNMPERDLEIVNSLSFYQGKNIPIFVGIDNLLGDEFGSFAKEMIDSLLFGCERKVFLALSYFFLINPGLRELFDASLYREYKEYYYIKWLDNAS